MPHFDELYPGRFLKGTTLDGPTVIRIVSVGGEKLQGDDGEKSKGVLKYKSAKGDGEIVWCKTNAKLCEVALGTADYTKWGGHLITIWHDPTVKMGAETVGGIRVYGSPELDRTRTVEIKRPRRKTPDRFTLHRTDAVGKPITTAPADAAQNGT